MINGKIFIAALAAVAAVVTVGSALAQTPLIEREATLKVTAETWSQTVCLQDLVQDGWLQGRCAVERNLCCRWNLGGQLTKTFKRTELARALAPVSFGGVALKLQGSDEVTVTQTHRELSREEIQAKVQSVAAAKYGEEGGTVGVTSIRLPSSVYVPLENESAWDVLLPEQPNEAVSARLIATGDAGRQIGWAQAALRLDAEVYVAKKTLHPNDQLRPEDFELKISNVLSAKLTGQAVFQKGQFPDSTRARQTILPGAPLSAAHVERIPMVRLGDTVTLLLRSDNLRISTKGVVQGSAALGDMVTVQLSRYNRTFRGRLVDGKLVEVWL